MNYQNLSELISLLKANNLYTEKKFGQNFLHNPQIIEKIVDSAEINSEDTIIEIGPGMGILTLELAKKAKKVISLELDQKLIPHLTTLFKDCHNIELINQDALKFQPPNFPYKLVANIPYYITSPILNHFLNPADHPVDNSIDQNAQRPSLLVLLMQLEVAQKITSPEDDHSILSLTTQNFGEPKIISKVAPGNFLPAPKVDSAILKITTFSEPKIQNLKLFRQLINRAFSQKRKTLNNTLTKGFPIDSEIIKQAFEKSNLNLQSRPQNLSLEDWKNLILNLEKSL